MIERLVDSPIPSSPVLVVKNESKQIAACGSVVDIVKKGATVECVPADAYYRTQQHTR
jgi:hypothetical protein